MDGTLWNSTSNIVNAYNEYLEKEKGWKNYFTISRMQQAMGMTIEEIANFLFCNEPKEERLSFIHQCMAYENEYLSIHGGELYPDVETTLQELAKSYDLMIVTNAGKGYIESMFKAHGLAPYFKDYESYGGTGLDKDKNIRLIMERNQVETAYYIGDTQKDKELCEKANVPFIYASYGFGTVTEYERKIDTFSELLTLFPSIL